MILLETVFVMMAGVDHCAMNVFLQKDAVSAPYDSVLQLICQLYT